MTTTQENFLIAVETLRKAHQVLNAQWDNLTPEETHELEITVNKTTYPFHKSFDDLWADIKTWEDRVREKFNGLPVGWNRYELPLDENAHYGATYVFENEITTPIEEVKAIWIKELKDTNYLYILEHTNGKFWTIAERIDAYGTFEECEKLLEREFGKYIKK